MITIPSRPTNYPNSQFVNPQVWRVREVDHRIRVADALMKPDTAYIAGHLLRGIRRDVLTEKPHRMDLPGTSLLQKTIAAWYQPTEVVKDWRKQINQRLALIEVIGKPGK